MNTKINFFLYFYNHDKDTVRFIFTEKEEAYLHNYKFYKIIYNNKFFIIATISTYKDIKKICISYNNKSFKEI